MITPEEVVRRIELYFRGGVAEYLTPAQAAVAAARIPELHWGNRPSAEPLDAASILPS
jgi:hypothetical protein